MIKQKYESNWFVNAMIGKIFSMISYWFYSDALNDKETQ